MPGSTRVTLRKVSEPRSVWTVFSKTGARIFLRAVASHSRVEHDDAPAPQRAGEGREGALAAPAVEEVVEHAATQEPVVTRLGREFQYVPHPERDLEPALRPGEPARLFDEAGRAVNALDGVAAAREPRGVTAGPAARVQHERARADAAARERVRDEVEMLFARRRDDEGVRPRVLVVEGSADGVAHAPILQQAGRAGRPSAGAGRVMKPAPASHAARGTPGVPSAKGVSGSAASRNS